MGKKSTPAPPDPVSTAAAQAAANKEAAVAQAKINMVDQYTPWGSMTYRQVQPQTEKPTTATAYPVSAPKSDPMLDSLYADYDALQANKANMSPDQYGYQYSNTMNNIRQRGGDVNNRGVVPQTQATPSQAAMGDDVPRFEVTTRLSPEQQQLLDMTNEASMKYGRTANQQLDALSSVLGTPFDTSSLGAAPQMNDEYRQRQLDAMLSRMAPEWERDMQRTETRLANQGIAVGSEAYNREMARMSRAMNDARMAADMQAGNEAARMFQMESAARDRAINEMMMARSQPLNELAAMLSGAQVQQPSFVPTPQTGISAPDIMGATYANYNAAANQAAQNRQGLYGLAGAGLGAFGMLNPFGWGV